ncbi:MAG: signal peptide peptidase SppA [Synoicihabitans sp.]
MFLLLVGAAAFQEPSSAAVPTGSYVVLDLRTNITDAPAQFDDSALSAVLSGQSGPTQLQHRLVIRALHEMANDDRIKGLVIKGSFSPAGYGTSYAALAEIRRALVVFKASGKPIHAYLEYPDLRDIYIASVADDIALDPNGAILVPGLASQPMFYAGLFEKYGIGVQVARVGKFKSAVEPFTRRDLSPENEEQLQTILDDLWQVMRNEIAVARGLDGTELQGLIDAGEAFLADDVLAAGLVDRLIYLDVLLDELKAATGRTNSERAFKQVGISKYIAQLNQVEPGEESLPAAAGAERGRVAVVYAEGDIVNGEGRFDQVGGARFARAIRGFRQDPDVKALVLRVNSPGGSATASDQIRREIELAAERMPVVVSMGGYAASGGYWISMADAKVFAEPTTITGSIGVFGMLLNVEELADSFGLTFDTVKTGKFADAATIARPKTPDEMAIFQRSVSEIYDDFVELVAENRDMPEERVREVAEGRVWSGLTALEMGLIDEMGGLSAAVAYAAEEADLKNNFRLTEFPRKRELADVITEALEGMQTRATGSGIGAQIAQQLQKVSEELDQFDDPLGIYARMPLELELP